MALETSGMMTARGTDTCDDMNTKGYACPTPPYQAASGNLGLSMGVGSRGSIVYKHYSNGVFQGAYVYQLKDKSNLDTDLTVLAGITPAAGDQYEVSISGKVTQLEVYFTGSGPIPADANHVIACEGNGHVSGFIGGATTCECNG